MSPNLALVGDEFGFICINNNCSIIRVKKCKGESVDKSAKAKYNQNDFIK